MKLKKDHLHRAGWLFLALTFIVTGLGVGVYAFWQSTQQDDSQQQSSTLAGQKLPGFDTVKRVDELQVADLKKGKGTAVKASSTVTVHYIGALASSGRIFDSSFDRGQPLITPLNEVIRGWQGLIGMKAGGERRILIPAELAYGKAGAPPDIPPNADLVFEVLLLETN